MQVDVLHIGLVALLAYLACSLPFGLIITRLMGLGDLRQIGSGNIGATNVLRTGSKTAAAATLILDIGKGAVAVMITEMMTHQALLVAVAAIFSVTGHCFPLWLKFKGGKGVATGIGVVVAMHPLSGAVMILTWLATAAMTRISSVAAIVSYLASPLILFFLADEGEKAPLAIAALVIAVLSVARHRANIARLLAGNEPKIGR